VLNGTVLAGTLSGSYHTLRDRTPRGGRHCLDPGEPL